MMPILIFWPVTALAGLTMVVAARLAWLRVTGSLKKPGEPGFYDPRQKIEAPAHITNTSDHLRNLFEFPVLFYAVCIISYLTGNVDHWQLYLAWAFVGLRSVHTAIHLTTNTILHRFGIFILSFFVLIALWVRLGLGL
jgi:hypothetical protein